MSTATSFDWQFPWEEMVWGFNQFITMFDAPLAIAGALILVVGIITFAVGMLRRARS
jgi:hypothetical protein